MATKKKKEKAREDFIEPAEGWRVSSLMHGQGLARGMGACKHGEGFPGLHVLQPSQEPRAKGAVDAKKERLGQVREVLRDCHANNSMLPQASCHARCFKK